MPYKIRGKCIYKKDGGAKVGCTNGDVHKYLAALHANANEGVNDSELKFDIDTYDYSSGQDYIKATLRKGNKLLAYADLAKFEGKVYINFIESVIKGKGYGTELMRRLANEYGYENLERSSLTDDGAKMRQKLDKEFNFDYAAHQESKNKHLNLNIVDHIKNDVVKGFLLDLINLGYSEAWAKLKKNPNFLRLNDELNSKYDLDFNDIADVSEWFKTSKTNDNHPFDEVPHPVLKDLSTFLKIPNDAVMNENIKKSLRKTLLKEVYTENHNKALSSAIDVVCVDLGIERPEIEFISDPNYTKKHKSFAAYSPSEKKVYVVTHNRNTADIMRSIAHELMHLKQDIDGRLTFESGKDGDEFENEANTYSGKIMRKIGREIPGIFESKEQAKLLGEDYDTNIELNNIANKVFYEYIRRSVYKLVYDNEFVKSVPNIFGGMSGKSESINNFLNSFKLNFMWDKRADSSFFRAKNATNGDIVLNHDDNDFINTLYNEVWKNFKDVDRTQISREELDEVVKDVYYKTYKDTTISTILHELQHAYDGWRSNLKYNKDKSSNDYYSKLGSRTELPDDLRTKYLRLQHEINARFSQFIIKHKPVRMNYGDRKDIPVRDWYMIPLKDFLNDLQKNFYGYNEMTDKSKKYLNRRASQYWHRAEELIKEKNIKRSVNK